MQKRNRGSGIRSVAHVPPVRINCFEVFFKTKYSVFPGSTNILFFSWSFDKSSSGKEVHPPSRVNFQLNFDDNLYEKNVDPFARAKSCQQLKF